MYCKKCGKEIKNNQKFCSHCGAQILESKQVYLNQDLNNKLFKFKSMDQGKVEITLNDNRLTISRPGIIAKFSHGFTGEKTILINQITEVQLKIVGFARGYIQFLVSGHEERKSGVVKGTKDENIVYFDNYGKKQNTIMNENAEYIKNYIEEYNSRKNNNQPKTFIQQNDKYDKLSKLKKLLDENVINQEEFEKEKQKILNS